MPETAWPSGIDVRDVTVVAVGLAGFVLLVPVQLASMILFDATRLDAVVPTVGFMALVPAAAVALLPLVIAARTYARERALAVAGGLFLAYAAFAVYLIQFYLL